MTEKLEYSAADMASAAAGGWRDGQRAAAEAAQPAPAGEQPAPYGWVVACRFFAAREDAVDAAEKTPCVEVYSRPQVLAILDRSAERQALAEELARLLKQSGDEFRALKSAPAGEREAVDVVGYRVSMPGEPELGSWLDEEAESEPQIQAHEPLMTVAQHNRILAAWQRTQAAGVPEGWREDVYLAAQMLTWGDADGGLTERQITEIEQHAKKLFDMLAAPAQPASPAQPEVQRLREALRECLGVLELHRLTGPVYRNGQAALAASTGNGDQQRLVSVPRELLERALSVSIYGVDSAVQARSEIARILAASAGQEVDK